MFVTRPSQSLSCRDIPGYCAGSKKYSSTRESCLPNAENGMQSTRIEYVMQGLDGHTQNVRYNPQTYRPFTFCT